MKQSSWDVWMCGCMQISALQSEACLLGNPVLGLSSIDIKSSP